LRLNEKDRADSLFALRATDLLADAIDLASLLALLWLLHGCHIRVLATPTPGIGVRNRKGNSEQTNKKSNTQFHGETPSCLKAANEIYWLGPLRSTTTFVTQPKLFSLAPKLHKGRPQLTRSARTPAASITRAQFGIDTAWVKRHQCGVVPGVQ